MAKVIRGFKPGTRDPRQYLVPSDAWEAALFAGMVDYNHPIKDKAELWPCEFTLDHRVMHGDALVIRLLPDVEPEVILERFLYWAQKYAWRVLRQGVPDAAKVEMHEPYDSHKW